MKVCLICSEIFAWGKYGGFGRSTRMLGRELVRQGIEVTAVVPRRKGQSAEEWLDGMRVLSFPLYAPWRAMKLLRECDADVYHSQHPSLCTSMAIRAMPERKHMITVRDPKSLAEMLVELRYPSVNVLRTLLSLCYENMGVASALRRADGVFAAAPYLSGKIRRLYGLKKAVFTLASPIAVPQELPEPNDRPTVCFLARLDRRKRPELFFELAAKRPNVRFIAMGESNDESWNRELRERYGHLPNLEMLGFVDQFSGDRLSLILGRSWILVNTAPREGLPTSFLEALAHRCALLSRVNPDGLTERFGYHVKDDDFLTGLDRLLEGDSWRERAERGYCYVGEKYELRRALTDHLRAYANALA